jgi:hypothetical protein
MNCTHDWGRYANLPWGEGPSHYRQCKLCDVLGYIKRHGHERKDRPDQVHVIHCYVPSCPEVAVGRLPGLQSGRLRWSCSFHLSHDPARS